MIGPCPADDARSRRAAGAPASRSPSSAAARARVLAARRHDGPLVVQKPLYPEGDAVCHAIVVHPPAGIAGGDELAIDVRCAARRARAAHHARRGQVVSLGGRRGRAQRVTIEARRGARVEWLPQETIVFDGARADIECGGAPRGRRARSSAGTSCASAAPAPASASSAASCASRTRIARDGKLVVARARAHRAGRRARARVAGGPRRTRRCSAR